MTQVSNSLLAPKTNTAVTKQNAETIGVMNCRPTSNLYHIWFETDADLLYNRNSYELDSRASKARHKL